MSRCAYPGCEALVTGADECRAHRLRFEMSYWADHDRPIRGRLYDHAYRIGIPVPTRKPVWVIDASFDKRWSSTMAHEYEDDHLHAVEKGLEA